MVSRKNLCMDLIILLIFAVIPFLYYTNTLLIFNNAQLYLNPVGLVHDITYVWNSHYNLGGNIGWGMGGFFPMFSFFAVLVSLGLPILIVDKLWLICLLFGSGISMYFLFSIVSSNAYRIAKFTAGLSYMYSLYAIVNLAGLHPFLVFYMALPLMLGLYILNLRKGFDLKYIILLTFASLLMSAYNPTLILINFLVLGIFYLYYLIAIERRNILTTLKFNLIFMLSYAAVSLYWIVPVVNYASSAWWSQIFSEPLTMQNIGSSYTEVFRQLGFWGFYSGYKGETYFAFSTQLLQNSFLIIISLIIPLLAIIAVIHKPRDKIRLFFALLLIICIPMAVASYPPSNPHGLGVLYQWAYNNIPFFSVFRDNYKFVMPIALACSTLIAFLINDLFNISSKYSKKMFLIKKHPVKLNNIAVGLIISIVIVNAWPIYTGNVIRQNQTVPSIPSYWYDAATWLNNMPGDGSVLLMPEQYFPVYTWGKKAGDINVALFNRPQVFEETSSGAYYTHSAQAMNAAYSSLTANETKYAGKILGLLGVEYILQRNDVDWKYYDVQSPDEAKLLITRQNGIHFERSFDELDFYKNDYYVSVVYAASNIIYINGSIESIPSSSLLEELTVNNSSLFFSMSLPSQNEQILGLATDAFLSNGTRSSVFYKTCEMVQPNLTYSWINPTQCNVEVNASTPFLLVFSQSYHQNWAASIDGKEITGHFMANGYANSWYINKTGTLTIKIAYSPQQTYDVCKVASSSAVVILALSLVLIHPKIIEAIRSRKESFKSANYRHICEVSNESI
jgi:arabinofuranan 3-O-arabinosyltransferase